ncbi:hypothetical protein IPM62_03715 [Candidatus Woesebacteria bacterium]|nr:MAG: hypothetical protein IPM62_03715 [Candidatus Woesebacteria bacterium]
MKLILIHGDDIEQSRARLQKFIDSARDRKIEIIKIDCAKENLQEKMSANTLFETKKLYILENLGKVGKKEMEWFSKSNDKSEDTSVIYLTSRISAAVKKNLPKVAKEELFELPNEIWMFLDSVYPGNLERCLNLLHRTLDNKPAEFVVAMLAGHLKDLYHVQTDPDSFKQSPWRISKLKTQAAKFEGDKLEAFIHGLAEIDIASKTSSDNLADLLDFMIIDNLE